MNKSVIIAVAAAIVALAAIGFALALSDDDDGPRIENPPLPTAPPGGEFPTVGPGTPIPSEPQVTVTPIDPGSNPQLPADRRPEAAPIESVEVIVAESFPPQYFLSVRAGLPSGCVQQYKHDVERDGDVITVKVLNSIPTATDIACTTIYGIYELNIALGIDFDSGETYTVLVNDQETTFMAQ